MPTTGILPRIRVQKTILFHKPRIFGNQSTLQNRESLNRLIRKIHKNRFTCRTELIVHQRGSYWCPLVFPENGGRMSH